MPKNKICVFPVTERPQVLATDPNFFFYGFIFLQLILLAENAFSFKSIFVATYVKANFTKSSQTICFCNVRALQTTRQLRSNC